LIACRFSGKTGSTPGASKTFQPLRCGLISMTVIPVLEKLKTPTDEIATGAYGTEGEQAQRAVEPRGERATGEAPGIAPDGGTSEVAPGGEVAPAPEQAAKPEAELGTNLEIVTA
jgi:hypothetical protein